MTDLYVIHRSQLPEGSAAFARARQWLSDEENRSAQRLKSAKARHCHQLGRLLTRAALAERLDGPPNALPIDRDSAGKPQLAGGHWHFNISHSHDWVAVALNEQAPVGVDIECPQRERPLLSIAQHYFHPNEIRQLQSVPATERDATFYRLWTLKEAFFKARGTGISEGLAQVDFSQQPPVIGDKLAHPHWRHDYWPLAWQDKLYLACASDPQGGEPTLLRQLPAQLQAEA